MCTVVFIPQTDKIYFASLRDESPLRPKALLPEIVSVHQTKVLAPKDALAGGTWLGLNNHQNIIILLNGGFEKHAQQPPYRKSRGLIVSELLGSAMPIIDWELLDLVNIEPFTLLVWSQNMLFHLVWDGELKHRTALDSSTPHLFSSSTLYDRSAKNKRSNLFHAWMSTNPIISGLTLLDFFRSAEDKENGFIIKRSGTVETLSYSFIAFAQQEVATLDYYQFEKNIHAKQVLEMKIESGDCAICV